MLKQDVRKNAKGTKMTDERPPITKEKCVQLGREHWRKIDGSRSYAGTPDVDTGIGAIAFAWYEAGGSFANTQPDEAETFDKFLMRLSAVTPETRLTRPKPSGEPLKMPEVWRDPVTNEVLPSPFSLEDDAARLRATSALAKHDPELLAHFEAMHADPYGHVQALREAEAKRLKQVAVKYGEAEHKANPFVTGATETAKSKFIREYPDLVETYQRETEPIHMPIGKNKNMTLAGKIARDPKLHAIVSRADEIIRVWNEQERERLRAAKAQAEQELKRLEAA
jgi:hypothetical protein